MNQIPSIVSGNDFILSFYVYSPAFEDGNTVMKDFDLSECYDIEVKLIHSSYTYIASYTLDEAEHNLLKIKINSELAVGSYGIEITGKTSDGKNWRYKGKKGECFNIVDSTSAAQYTTEGEHNINAVIGFYGTDMSDYYSKEDVDDMLENLDLADYAHVSDLFSGDYNDLINKPVIPTVPTRLSSFINDVGFLTRHQSLANYALKSELFSRDYNDLINKPIIPTIPTNISAFNNDAHYITEDQDLSHYALKSELFSGNYNDLTNKPTQVSVFNNDANYITGSQLLLSLEPYQLKSQAFSGNYNDLTNKPTIPSLSGYATETWVSNKLNDILGIDAAGITTLTEILSDNDTTTGILTQIANKANSNDVYTKSEINNMGYLQSHQSLDNYYTKDEINNAGYIQSHQSLADYPTKSDISNASYVTSSQLSEMGYLTSHQSLDNYVTKTDLDSAGYLQSHQSLDNYYTKEQINNAGYLTSHQSLNGYATETWVNNKFDDMLGINAEGITSLANILNDEDKTTGILSEIARKANANDVYTKTEVDNMIPESGNLSNYVSYTQANSYYAVIDHTHDDYVSYTQANSYYVTVEGDKQLIYGPKTFIGDKRINFRQGTPANKLGFTLYDVDEKEVGGLEWRPDTIGGRSLLSLQQYIGTTGNKFEGVNMGYLGFRLTEKTQGKYNLITPLPSYVNTIETINVGNNYRNFFFPLVFKNGSNKIYTDCTGLVDLSTFVSSTTSGLKIKVVASMPASPDANTIYIVQ